MYLKTYITVLRYRHILINIQRMSETVDLNYAHLHIATRLDIHSNIAKAMRLSDTLATFNCLSFEMLKMQLQRQDTQV